MWAQGTCCIQALVSYSWQGSREMPSWIAHGTPQVEGEIWNLRKLRLMWAKGQILSERLEGEAGWNGDRKRLQGVKKEENLESGWAASPRQCEMGTHSSQPPLNPLNAPAEGRRGELKTLAKMFFTQRVQRCPVWFSLCPTAVSSTPEPGGFGSCRLRLSQGSHHGVVLHPFLSAPPLLPIVPCHNHVLNTLQMLLDVFLTHFLWSPCYLLCRNNCNLFKCQQATRGRQQLCARAEQLRGTGPISPLEQRTEAGERKRSFASIN